MSTQHARQFSRRRFLGGLTLAGTAGLLGLSPRRVAAEPPPETPTLRLTRNPGICRAPQYITEELLHSEGFMDVQYPWLDSGPPIFQALAAGEVDIAMALVVPLIMQVDAGAPVMLLAGGHVGCLALVGSDRVRAIRDLKGKTVVVSRLGTGHHAFLASMMAYVGMDPRKDVTWVEHPDAEWIQLLAEGKIDAFLAESPVWQEAQEKRIGRVLLDTALDGPWAQYFCCMVAGNRSFVQKHPVATKRALRAILKAATICALEPERVAQALVEKGHTPRYDYALEGLKGIPYAKWREYDAEDTVRFYALRLHEIAIIKSSPQKIIAQGTDWRFLNELKKELKE